ncbi:MAG: hypothetical protein H7A49_09335 [Akkermansiaceae bacterium]|nr:hypothetical protein [Akkermansiaceae bacterium]MCP5544095.1 hypothetical protein [Akkermansiaceae bacterium]MCP5547849.1 hypothetical protein [Akkermansiaceae bacterium]
MKPEQQQKLAADLEPRALRKMPATKRAELQNASLAFSERALGRQPNGKLKQVKDETEKRLLRIAGEYLNSLPPGEVPAHARAAEFFGEVPANARRITRTISIDPKSELWHSTGLYAAPGEVVTVKVPDAWTNRGLRVRLSGHADGIPQKKPMVRLPTPVSRSFEITGSETQAASAFGGAVYIETGKRPIEEAPFEVTISNALAAPGFKLGSTTPEQWRASLRNAPAPYAEFLSDRIALSFPSAWIRDMDDPTELMKYWDHIVELHDELGGFAHLRTTAERVNVDVQISAGLFHAGYPMQGPQEPCKGMVDLASLREHGNWGWFHELGHESQRRPDKRWGWDNPYTFDGSIECTVNLFSAHAYDRLKIAPKGGWAWTVDPKQVAEKARNGLAKGTPFAKADVGTRLAMFLQLRDAFGWQPIAALLKSYSDDHDRSPELLPRTNDEERDQLCVRLSNILNRNLYPFLHDLWGIEISDAARDKVSNLPPWMPEGFVANS